MDFVWVEGWSDRLRLKRKGFVVGGRLSATSDNGDRDAEVGESGS